MPLGLGLGITKLKSLVSGLRVRFQGNATITAALDGILRELSADFVSNGTVTAALEAIKLLDVDFSGDGTLTADLASFEGLLDLYPNAAAAYSVRLLSGSYTGALVRIRKDTGGQPEKDFYPDSNNELSLNSSDGGTTLGSWIGSNDGYIVTWYSQAGVSGRDATQSSASSQPQIISGGSLITDNGKAAIQFDGSNSRLRTSSTIISNSDLSLFLLKNNLNVGTIPQDFVSQGTADASGNGFKYGISGGGADQLAVYNTPLYVSTGATSVTGQELHSLINTGSTTTLKIDNSSETLSDTSGDQVGAATDPLTLGNRDNISAFFNGYMQEVILYASNQSTNENNINTNINDFYSIY